MRAFGIFEIKTKLSQICEEVARTNEEVLVTRRGRPFVRIVPISHKGAGGSEVWEARERYDGQLQKAEELSLPEREVEPVYNPFNEKDQ
jgi:prevent-host-death family protein